MLLCDVLLASHAAAGDCVDYGDHLHWVGDTYAPEYSWGVDIQASYAFIADSYEGLKVIDVSDPRHPVQIGSIDTYDARAVHVHAVRANAPTGRAVVCSSSDVVGAYYAYVADMEAGIKVIDVSDPTGPLLIGEKDLGDKTYDVVFRDGLLFAASGTVGLQILDLSDAANPATLGSVNTPGTAQGMDLAGSYAHVADGAGGLQVIDVSDPTLPVIVGSSTTSVEAHAVDASEGIAYIAGGIGGLEVVDVSDPENPLYIGGTDEPGDAWDVEVRGDYAFVADGFGAFHAADVSDPSAPDVVGSLITTLTYPVGVAISGDLAYVAGAKDFFEDTGSLQIFDITYPHSPEVIGHAESRDLAQEVFVRDGYAYVADDDDGLTIMDVSYPSSPEIVGWVDTPDAAQDVAVEGTWAYVADRLGGVQIIGVMNPENPSIAGQRETPGTCRGVTVADGFLYVADGKGGGITIFELGDFPFAPTRRGRLPLPGMAMHVAIDGPHAYVAGRSGGLQVVDVSDPDDPWLVATVPLSHCNDVVLDGDFAFAADADSALVVVDISNPLAPGVVVSRAAPGYGGAIEVVEGTAYVASSFSGVTAVDVTDPVSPVVMASVLTPSPSGYGPYGVATDGSYIYAADGRSGVAVLPLHCEMPSAIHSPNDAATREVWLRPASPNPFGSRTSILCVLGEPRRMNVGIYDVTGRVVRVLVAGDILEAGHHTLSWDGRDARGNAVAAGVYLFRLQAGGHEETERVVLLK